MTWSVARGRTALVVALAVAALSGACATAQARAKPPATSLTVRYFPHGQEQPGKVWHLRCHPPRGDHPRRAAACAELARSGKLLIQPMRRPCNLSLIAGDPTALVKGRVRGKHVDRVYLLGCDGGAFTTLHALLTGR